MSQFTSEERIALLLSVLGNDVANAAVQSMNPTRAKFVQGLVNDYQVNPPSEDETNHVIEDFFSYFQTAIDSLTAENNQSQVEDSASPDVAKVAAPASANKQITYFPTLVPGNDPVNDLNRLDPYQISVALGNDHPKTVALVLSKLEPQLAAKVLEELAEETRLSAVVYLSQESTVPALIVDNVLKTTVQKAITVEFRAHEVDQSQVLADLMRSVPKNLRGDLLAKLEESNADFCAEVRKKLYVFEDIARLDDRDVQKMMGEIQTDFLVVGLQGAEQEIIDKLLGNLSKRARQSVIEEMEYRTSCTPDEIDAARTELTSVLARLDEAGEVTLN